MRYSPINDGYIIKEEEFEEVQALLEKLHNRLLVVDSVGADYTEEIKKILDCKK